MAKNVLTSGQRNAFGQNGIASTSQSDKAVKGQKKNDAGGYTFTISPMDRAKRFLILGSETAYYGTPERLTKQNADNLIKIAESGQEQHLALVNLIVEVSEGGRAAKQDFGLFALAVASSFGTQAGRAYAYQALPAVARTASSLFTFVLYSLQFHKFGMGMQKAVSRWYAARDADSLGYQGVKYRQREGFTHRDLIKLSRPQFNAEFDEQAKAVLSFLVTGEKTKGLPEVVKGFRKAQKTRDAEEIVGLIKTYPLTWDMLPTEVLNSAEVWGALLDNKRVPLGALVRQLARLTRLEVVKPLDKNGKTGTVLGLLTDAENVKRSRLHPLSVLQALRTYESGGRLSRGSAGTYTPVQDVVDVLETTFMLAMDNVEATGKRFLLGLDVSGSMSALVNADTSITSRDAATAMAMATVHAEDQVHVIGFTGGYAPHGGRSLARWGQRATERGTLDDAVTVIPLSDKKSLSHNINLTSNLPFGSTDCALPMVYAMEKGLEVDVFVIYTDNDTWVGKVHPFQALQQYRAKTGIDAKLVVMSTSASRFSIADPSDPGMLDIVGFDSASPKIISEFAKGL
jgi:60 kDa SS-A/Ro ribonucleoprotein